MSTIFSSCNSEINLLFTVLSLIGKETSRHNILNFPTYTQFECHTVISETVSIKVLSLSSSTPLTIGAP